MKALHTITLVLLVVGGLNWGLKLFGWDLDTWGFPSSVDNIIYGLVALSAIYEAVTHTMGGGTPATPQM